MELGFQSSKSNLLNSDERIVASGNYVVIDVSIKQVQLTQFWRRKGHIPNRVETYVSIKQLQLTQFWQGKLYKVIVDGKVSIKQVQLTQFWRSSEPYAQYDIIIVSIKQVQLTQFWQQPLESQAWRAFRGPFCKTSKIGKIFTKFLYIFYTIKF